MVYNCRTGPCIPRAPGKNPKFQLPRPAKKYSIYRCTKSCNGTVKNKPRVRTSYHPPYFWHNFFNSQ